MSGMTSSQKMWPAKILRQFEPYDYVRTAVGLLLLTASGLKAWQVLFDPTWLALQSGILSSKWAVIAIVEIEMLLGVCLLMNLWRRAAWATTTVLFGVFAVYSAMTLFSGEPCGCFGAAGTQMPAWATSVLDVMVIAALWMFGPSVAIARQRSEVGTQCRLPACTVGFRMPLNVIATFASLTLVPAVGAVVALHSPATTVWQPGFQVFDGRYVVVEPNEWIGKRLPLLEYIDIGENLLNGEWRLLFYDQDCPKCRAVLDNLSGSERACEAAARRIAIIDVLPLRARPAPASGFLNAP